MSRLYVAIPADAASRTAGKCAGCDTQLSRPTPEVLADVVFHLTVEQGEAVFLCLECGESLRGAERMMSKALVMGITETEYEIRVYP